MDLPIHPPLLVKDTPKPRPLRSLADARAFVDVELRIGRPPPWRELQRRLENIFDEEDAVEAIGALRELLDTEGLLVHPKEGFIEPDERRRG